MRIVFGLVLIAGLALAGFAVYMAQNYIGAYQTALEQERSKSHANVPVQGIYVATRALDYGEIITNDDIALMPWPQQTLPDTYFDKANPLNAEGAELRVALRPIERNEAIMASKVSEPGALPGITSRLAPGMRAFTIPVDVESGVSGFLRPGDRVDVYWSGRLNLGAQSGQEITRLIETGLELIAIDQSSEISSQPARVAETVTVQVTPQQVANLAQAQTTGLLMLSLVGQGDETIATAIEVDQRSLLGIAEETRVVEEIEAPEEICTIRNRRGSEVVETEIPCTN